MAERREGDLYRSASVVDSVGKRVGFLEMPKLIVPDQGSFPGKKIERRRRGIGNTRACILKRQARYSEIIQANSWQNVTEYGGGLC